MDIGTFRAGEREGERGRGHITDACHIVALCDTHVNITIFG